MREAAADRKATISSIGVVVPAHNEARLIDRCLQSLQEAAARVSVPVRVLVVLDACSDETFAMCEAAGVQTRSIDAHNVGVARAVGMRELLHGQIRGRWLATTDADSVVDADWLRKQVELADRGADVVVGVVRVCDWDGDSSVTIRRYEDRYRDRAGTPSHGVVHQHVHGANLGFRAAAYAKVGGFPPVGLHEDRLLVDAFESLPGLRIIRSTAVEVMTSARSDFRVSGGFGQFLVDLRHEDAGSDADPRAETLAS